MSDTLRRLQELHQAASGMPWKRSHVTKAELHEAHAVVTAANILASTFAIEKADADLIVAMRNTLPALLKIAEAAESFAAALDSVPFSAFDQRHMTQDLSDTAAAFAEALAALDNV